MKSLLTILALIFSINSIATEHKCLPALEKQLLEHPRGWDYSLAVRYFLKIKGLAHDKTHANSSIYGSLEDQSITDIEVFKSNFDDWGCVGETYISFETQTCKLLAIGGGSCE